MLWNDRCYIGPFPLLGMSVFWIPVFESYTHPTPACSYINRCTPPFVRFDCILLQCYDSACGPPSGLVNLQRLSLVIAASASTRLLDTNKQTISVFRGSTFRSITRSSNLTYTTPTSNTFRRFQHSMAPPETAGYQVSCLSTVNGPSIETDSSYARQSPRRSIYEIDSYFMLLTC